MSLFSMGIQRKILLAITFLLFILIPSYALIFRFNPLHNMSLKAIFSPTSLFILLNHFFIFLFILLIFFIACKLTKSYKLQIGLTLISSLCYLVAYFIIFYESYTNAKFDPFFLLDAYQEIIPTGYNILGFVNISSVILLLVFLEILFFFLIFNNYSLIKNDKYFIISRKLLFFLPFLILIPWVPSEYSYFTEQSELVLNTLKIRNSIKSNFPDNSIYNTSSNENIFLLQIESGNGLIASGSTFQFKGKQYEDIYIPYLYNISKKGIFFPFFYANSMLTNRAQATILCGSAGNLNRAFSYRPESIPTVCLPEILRKSGYKTIYFRASDLEFTNLGNFAKAIGFDEIHHDDIMKEEDIKHGWGYDDCIFYKRAFEYLNEHYANESKLFVYFEVSSHHYGFYPKDKYNFTHKFESPSNFVETYLNSLLEQDYCVSKFYEEYENFNNQNTHLFILPDTSWPVGINNNTLDDKNAYNDNFLTFLAYLPPKNKQDKFRVGATINDSYSQTDIIPTIFSLLNNESYQNSFAFELKKGDFEKRYEKCHVLTQPYTGGQIAIVQDRDKYIYNFSNKNLIYYDLKKDPFEQKPFLISKNYPFIEFIDKYYCKRYKT